MLPYGAFCVCEDAVLQQKLYEELKGVWPDVNAEGPSYEQLVGLEVLVCWKLFPWSGWCEGDGADNNVEWCCERDVASYAWYNCRSKRSFPFLMHLLFFQNTNISPASSRCASLRRRN